MSNKIAFISEHASPLALLGGTDSGGQNVYVGELAIQLADLGFEIDIYTRWDNPDKTKIVAYQAGVRVIHVEAGPIEEIAKEEIFCYMDEFTADMLGFINDEGLVYQLIHANFWMSGLVAANLKKVLNVPFVITFHALGHIRKLHQKEQDKFPPQRVAIEEEIVQCADHIIAECPQDKKDLLRYYHAEEEKVTVIPCGFNPQEFFPMYKELSRQLLHLDKTEKVILQLGRMVPRKGIDNVIRAVPLLKKAGINVRLVIVGGEEQLPGFSDGEEMTRLKELAEILGVMEQVTFTGRKDRKELKYYYAAADLFITTPWYEPFGITPLEAMACGTPVIGSRVGGIKYSIVDGKTGLLVSPNNPEMLADRIKLLFSNDKLLAVMGENAAQHVLDNFTWEKVAKSIKSLYERVLKEKTRNVEEQVKIAAAFEDAITTFRQSALSLSSVILEAAEAMIDALKNGHKILVCGNGGSAAESQHFAAELVGRFEIPYRNALPVISLTADTAVLTAWSNDFGYEEVFSRQVQAFGKKGDVLLCLSTSGASQNLISAMKAATALELTCINLLGKGGGEAVHHGNINIVVPSSSSQRIQEVHLHLVHLLCGLIESRLFHEKPLKQVQQEVFSPLKVLNGFTRVFEPGVKGRGIRKYGS